MKNLIGLFLLLTAALFGDARERLGFQKADTARVQQLVSNSYFGAFRLGYGAGEYFNNGFRLSTLAQDSSHQSFTWITKPGVYNQFHGYWIFRPNINQCWQARNANGPFAFWNADGRARGNPEDWELFVFEPADAEYSSVFVRNIWGRYVRYAPPFFICDADRSNAAAFFPEF